MRLIESDIRRQIDAHLADLLGRIFRGHQGERSDSSDSPGSPDDLARLDDSIRRFVLSGGKRIRPQLCVWTYQQCPSPAPVPGAGAAHPRHRDLPPSLLDLACAWELFHAFLLAHDDIIDAADARRGEPSLHHRLASLDGGSLRFGSNLAIVAGDLLCCGSMRLLHELDVPDRVFRPLLRLFSRIACTTGYGQAIDICQSHAQPGGICERNVLRQYHWKTAAYTFEGPMLSGAILAGLGESAQRALSAFALALGQAYQLQNDLIDLADSAHAGCDLVQGKRTITLLRARQAMPEVQRQSFDDRLASLRTANGKAVRIAEGLRRELLDAGADEGTRDLIQRFLSTARDAARDPALPASLSVGMNELLASLAQSYFAQSPSRTPSDAALVPTPCTPGEG